MKQFIKNINWAYVIWMAFFTPIAFILADAMTKGCP